MSGNNLQNEERDVRQQRRNIQAEGSTILPSGELVGNSNSTSTGGLSSVSTTVSTESTESTTPLIPSTVSTPLISQPMVDIYVTENETSETAAGGTSDNNSVGSASSEKISARQFREEMKQINETLAIMREGQNEAREQRASISTILAGVAERQNSHDVVLKDHSGFMAALTDKLASVAIANQQQPTILPTTTVVPVGEI